MSGDAVGADRADDQAWAHRLRLAVRVDELDEDLIAVGLHLGRGDAALDHPAERGEMGLEDSLSLVLRQAALELAAAIDAVVSHRAKLDHVRAVEAGTVDMLGGIEEGRQYADRVEDLESAGLDGRSSRLAVRPDFALDEPSGHAVASELGGGKQAGWAGADDQDVVAHRAVSREGGPAGIGVSPVMRRQRRALEGSRASSRARRGQLSVTLPARAPSGRSGRARRPCGSCPWSPSTGRSKPRRWARGSRSPSRSRADGAGCRRAGPGSESGRISRNRASP